MDEVQTDILVIGAGPAGLAAAVNARRSGKRVAVTDENPFPGGQIWRPFRDFHGTKAQRQLVQLFHAEVPVFSSTTVFDFKGDSTACVISPRGYGEIHFERVVLATGAREQFLPFPGWTMPGVLGVGGLQAMLKQGLEVRGRRVVVAGSGPLLLAVAKSLSRHGARILNVFEQANTRSLRKFFFSLWGHPETLLQAAGFYWTVQKLRPEWWVAEAHGGEKLEGVEVTNGWQRRRISCDLLACAYGLVPNTELAQLAGCRLKDGFVEVDEFQQTSQERFFCAGEPVGIGGVEAAEVQGAIAGLAAAGEEAQAERHFKARAKAAAFAEKLAEAFVLREELRHLASDDTIVCRCEDVRWGAIKDFATFREAKLQARLGMGACQGRICGAACRVLRGWETPTVRPPLVPVPAEVLAKEGAT